MTRGAKQLLEEQSVTGGSRVNFTLTDYYRCPEEFARFTFNNKVSGESGYFKFGQDTICYGRCSSGRGAEFVTEANYDALDDVINEASGPRLPFDPTEIVDNLRYERYLRHAHRSESKLGGNKIVRDVYYWIRPLLPVTVRKHFQKFHLRNWKDVPFPSWPVDCTVELINEKLLALSMQAQGVQQVPFIWFWPESHSCCAMMTHDVEAGAGLAFCPNLMDIDDAAGIKSSFQIVPEGRYEIPPGMLNTIRNRGFGVNVHDLNHDGRLYQERETFRRRAEKINRHLREFGSFGFRSGALYRNLDWYDDLEISYDMSVPNVAHLEPQRGGCCTVMPYFIGKILELPLTTTQDYSLFHILGDYSLSLWKRQMALIMEKHGLVSFIFHPDYVIEKRAQHTYRALLKYLSDFRSAGKIWITLPKEVDRWWRERSQMNLVREGGKWTIQGAGSEHARIAWATLNGDHVKYTILDTPASAEPKHS